MEKTSQSSSSRTSSRLCFLVLKSVIVVVNLMRFRGEKEKIIYSPIIVKINFLHLVFVGLHEEEISASSAELFRRDPQFLLIN